MSVSVDVHLMSGKMVSLEVEAETSVNTLRQRAQGALGVGNGRLLNSSGRVLPGTATIAEAKLQSGDVLTLRITQEVGVCTWSCLCKNLGRWIRGDLGRFRVWWRQQCGAGSAEGCAANTSLWACLRCNLGKWVCRLVAE